MSRTPYVRPAEPDPSWRERANCRGIDPELFFPGKGDNVTVRAAKAVCAGCEVRDECLAYAQEFERRSPGVWAGLSDRERRALRREARQVAS